MNCATNTELNKLRLEYEVTAIDIGVRELVLLLLFML